MVPPSHSGTDNSVGRTRPVAVWKESDSIRGEKVSALVIILDGPGCSWAKRCGCTMCGYSNDVKEGEVTSQELLAQFRVAMDRYRDEPYIKIFTSGSFLDPEEIPADVQEQIATEVGSGDRDTRLLVESRPEYISGRSVRTLSSKVHSLEVAVGLETSSDRVRSRFIRKGFTWEQYREAGETVRKEGALLKTYLLMKPPFMGEKLSVDDMVRSISDIHNTFPGSRISVNPMNIQSSTPVERLYRRGHYRPPWLWSLLDVLKEGNGICGRDTHLMSAPTAGGKRRGAHNCGKCDYELLEIISDFSINNKNGLHTMKGCCHDRWEEVISNSAISPVITELR